jgi:hypothetical protein
MISAKMGHQIIILVAFEIHDTLKQLSGSGNILDEKNVREKLKGRFL